MKIIISSIYLAIFIINMSLFSFAEDTSNEGYNIATQYDYANSRFVDYKVNVEMVLRTERGDESKRNMTISVLENINDGDKSIIVFNSPRDQRGTALLSYSHKAEPDDQFLYLPAIKRVKRITSKNKSGPFVGSEFSFEDIITQDISKYNYNYIRKEACLSLECFVVDRYPLDKYTGYSKQRVWFDVQNYWIIKIDYYDRKESLLKTLVMEEYRLYDDKWRSHFYQMTNHQTGKITELSFANYGFEIGFQDEDFSTNALKRIK